MAHMCNQDFEQGLLPSEQSTHMRGRHILYRGSQGRCILGFARHQHKCQCDSVTADNGSYFMLHFSEADHLYPVSMCLETTRVRKHERTEGLNGAVKQTTRDSNQRKHPIKGVSLLTAQMLLQFKGKKVQQSNEVNLNSITGTTLLMSLRIYDTVYWTA